LSLPDALDKFLVKKLTKHLLAMSFPQNNNGLPDGSTPINGGGMDGQFPPAPSMQGPPAGQNAANESARTLW